MTRCVDYRNIELITYPLFSNKWRINKLLLICESSVRTVFPSRALQARPHISSPSGPSATGVPAPHHSKPKAAPPADLWILEFAWLGIAPSFCSSSSATELPGDVF
ncbi:hypothetical protein PAAG_11247 [Paracoccidioides lutzii Pb01]|uniref:Uncharacterized protein n=1 Tax=Paracoccidioides lutzii (strain ATCC MYA-826 / Pb01) TaxID=502779 RepID=A0A0A2V2Q2_PARBA|nr:hypothetical protein PAAG_11247 [Paracoccidioides lutzii Pb01]KGQ02066.1 hypothetical protein PAAG_11247 [Paracoccidioides lutzii Pb01]